MAHQCASETGSVEPNNQKESSFVFLQILPEEQQCVSDAIVNAQELTPKYFSLDELQSFVPNFPQENVLQNVISENKINTEKTTDLQAKSGSSNNAHFNSSTTHVEIIHNSQPNTSILKPTTSKIEGRKAPGANRILPLITSVWEDADLHRKRQKLPKGGGKREIKGKSSQSNKRNVQGTFTVDDVSDEEDWLERQEKDDHGGSLYRAYSDFFMGEEGGEDREDCICGECGAEFLTATQVAHHLEYCHCKIGVKLHQCFVCRHKRYPSLVQLNQHLSKAHGIPRPQLTCRTCFMELAGESEAKAHSRKHQTPYTCSRCSLSHSQNGPRAPIPRFATCFLLAEHFREIHLPKERPYVCSICGRHFTHQFVRDLHLQRRHRGYSLTCPEVRHHPSSPLQKTVSIYPKLMLPKDSLNSTSTKSLVFLPITTTLDRPTVQDDISCGRISSPSETEARLVYSRQNQVIMNSSQDRNVQLPGNLRVTQQPSSLCCSKGSFLFWDEVSLLRHVFLSHEKATRLRLLKWAREVDKEDTLFEELWKEYSNVSSKQYANIADKDNQIEQYLQNKDKLRALPTSERISLNIGSIATQYSNENMAKNIPENSSSTVNHDDLFDLSQVMNITSNVNSASNSLLPNDITLSKSLPEDIALSLQCKTDSTALSLTSPCSTGPLLGKSHLQSPFPTTGSVLNTSSMHQVSQQFVSKETTPSTRPLATSIAEVPSSIEIPDAVNFCLMDVLNSVCNVLNKRCAPKESVNLSGNNSLQRNLLSVRCLLCRYLASNPMALERHRRRRHFRNKHCPFCSVACLSVDAVWRHVSETHLTSSIKLKVELQQQIQSQKMSQSSSGLRCPVCKKIFSSRGKCNNHQETVHKIEVVSRPLSCSICSKKFQFQKALERHHLLHSQDKEEDDRQTPFSCPHCDQTFLRPGFLTRHIASHFEDIRKEGKGKAVAVKGSFGHSCPSCPRRLSTHAKLKAHIRTSHPPSHLRQRFVCSQCPVRCNTASGLRVHMRVHTGERPFPCNECDMSFKRHTALRKHILAVHPVPSESSASAACGTGSFLKCSNCTSSFRDRSNLVRHFLQVHRGLRRFVCGLCGTRYGQNQDLRRHLKVNHDVDAPRIIGSDRRSVDQIYVVPPVLDGLPTDHPLASKIRLIVEEEEGKLDEDSLPHFTEIPQQLHLHIHKEPVTNAESASEEDKGAQSHSFNSHDSIQPSEAGSDDRNSCMVSCSTASLRNKSKSDEHEKIEHGMLLVKNKNNKLESESSTTQLSSRVESKTTKKKESPDKNVPLQQRNLILDALISSQISTEALQLENNVPIEMGSQLGQVFDSNTPIIAKGLENVTPQATEMNIIMTKQPLDSAVHSNINQVSFFQNSETANMDTSSIKIGKSIKKIARNKTMPVVSGNFSCCHCGKEFIDATRLERHSKVHSDLKPHVCSVCGKSFVEKCNLKVHMRSHTGERPYKCEVCGKSMRYLKELTDHRRMHLGERPHACGTCSRAFLRLRDLRRHLHIHSSEKRHKCPICNKAFSRLDHLRAVHMRVHEPWRSETSKKSKISDGTLEPVPGKSGLKINGEIKNAVRRYTNNEKETSQYQHFECQKCNKKFSTRAKLDKHLVLHSGQKVHKCSACGRSFALASYLRAHQNTHRKQQGYLQCPKCPRRFASQETLAVHNEKFHRRIEKMKKFQTPELNEKAGRSKDLTMDLCDEEKFFMTRPGDFDVNLDLEDEMNIQEVALFDPTSLSESEKHNTFVYLHVISDDLQLANESSYIE